MNKKAIVLLLFILFLTGCKEKEYVCLKGYTYEADRNVCTRVLEQKAVPHYYCKEQNEKVENKKCIKTDLTQAKISRVCNPGYYSEGGICIKDGTIVNYNKCGLDKTYDSKTGKCHDKVNVILLYKCDTGELDGSTCVHISESDALLEYVCPEEYELKGQMCYRTIKMDAVKK